MSIMIECPHCGTESKDGVSLCRGCNAEVTYKTTETMKSKVRQITPVMLGIMGLPLFEKGTIGTVVGSVMIIAASFLMYKWWWLNREYKETERTFTRQK